MRFESHDIEASRMLASSLVSMLAKWKLFQKPLDILSSGILLATDCRFMSCWVTMRNRAFQPKAATPLCSDAPA